MADWIQRTEWKQCIAAGAKWAFGISFILFVFFTLGHWYEETRPDGRFITFLLFTSIILAACLFLPAIVAVRGVRLYRWYDRRWGGLFWMAASVLLMVAALFLWRMTGAPLWEWLDVSLW